MRELKKWFVITHGILGSLISEPACKNKMEEEQLINESTYAHIARLVMGASCKIMKAILKNPSDMSLMRRLVIELSNQVETKMTRVLEQSKQAMLDDVTAKLSTPELALMRSAIAYISTVVSLMINSTVKEMRVFVFQFMAVVRGQAVLPLPRPDGAVQIKTQPETPLLTSL